MEFGLLTIGILVLAALLLLLVFKLLFQPDWFLGFLIGASASFLLALVIVLVATALNIATFQQLNNGQSLANLSFKKIGAIGQSYQVDATLSNASDAQVLTLSGDTWQANVIELNMFGQKFYKLSSIAGAYYSLDEAKQQSQFLHYDEVGIDLAKWFHNKSIGFLSVREYKTVPVVLRPEALFTLMLKSNKVSVSALNDSAKAASSL